MCGNSNSQSQKIGMQHGTATLKYTKLEIFLPHDLEIGEGVHQRCILAPYLFNIYAEYIM